MNNFQVKLFSLLALKQCFQYTFILVWFLGLDLVLTLLLLDDLLIQIHLHQLRLLHARYSEKLVRMANGGIVTPGSFSQVIKDEQRATGPKTNAPGNL